MQFGMFMEFATRSGGSEAEAFREGLALAEAADAWGLDAAWLAEFHFVPDRSVLSSPITLAAAIAGRTRHVSGSVSRCTCCRSTTRFASRRRSRPSTT